MRDDDSEADALEYGQFPPQPHGDAESDDGGESAGEQSHVSAGRRDDDLHNSHSDNETERVGEQKGSSIGGR